MKGGKLVNDCRPKNEETTNEAKKCWKGYEKKGTQKLFGKTYNRCVKKEETQNESASPGQGKQEKQSLEDSTKKDESLMREKILDQTLKHQAKRLEIPVGHLSALE